MRDICTRLIAKVRKKPASWSTATWVWSTLQRFPSLLTVLIWVRWTFSDLPSERKIKRIWDSSKGPSGFDALFERHSRISRETSKRAKLGVCQCTRVMFRKIFIVCIDTVNLLFPEFGIVTFYANAVKFEFSILGHWMPCIIM